MASYDLGKTEVCDWVRKNFPRDSTILDVGACDGKWRLLLPEYRMDACEIFPPNAYKLKGYNTVFIKDIKDLRCEWYDLIIFGDVIEHMEVPDAQAVIEYAKPRCRDMVIAVPYNYAQGELYGNRWERHIQDDLDPLTFYERYGLWGVIWVDERYCYYEKHK